MQKVGIIGVGKLGLCFALNLERSGYAVQGVDVSEKHVAALNSKSLISSEPGVEDLLTTSINFEASLNIEDILLDSYKLIFVFVETPSLPDGRFDHTKIDQIILSLIDKGRRREKILLVICSTTMPGYCDEISEKLKPYNYEVIYSPEFIAQGTILKDQRNPDQILIGAEDKEGVKVLTGVFKKICTNSPSFHHMSRLSAEIAKLATNCFLTTKISFANAIGDLATQMGAEPEKILEAVGADHRIGSAFLKYGFGYGGPCLPRDNRAMEVVGRDGNYELLFSKTTDEINQKHLVFMEQLFMKKFAPDQEIIFDQVSYKKGTEIIEESQQLALALRLAKKGHKVRIIEIQAVIDQVRDKYGNLFEYQVG
jgi:nucleotide sugar dehydrogenase